MSEQAPVSPSPAPAAAAPITGQITGTSTVVNGKLTKIQVDGITLIPVVKPYRPTLIRVIWGVLGFGLGAAAAVTYMSMDNSSNS